MSRIKLTVLVVFAVLASVQARAQAPSVATPDPEATELTAACPRPVDATFVFFVDHVPLRQVAQKVAAITCRRIEVDAAVAERTLTIAPHHLGKLRAEAVEALFRLALMGEHVTLRQDGDVLRVMLAR